MSKNIKKAYYAIIPANIRYDDELNANAKLLYGEITALCNEKGYCWASNSYFAELYGVAKETVSRWISKLENQGYIRTSLVYEKGTRQVKERRIYISDPIDENVNTPIDENVKDNTTVINNTINNVQKEEIDIFFNEVWAMYPNKKGKGRVSSTKKKEIHKLGDEFKRCIERYTDYVDNQRDSGFKELKHQNGSTFFNSGYVDYLDDNFEEVETNSHQPELVDLGGGAFKIK